MMGRSTLLLTFVLFATALFAADNLKLNRQLDYESDSVDGQLITGDNLSDGFVPGKPNYIIIYGEGCFNSKRQARRTVELYDRYKQQVHFIIVDLDRPRSDAQQQLVKAYYKGSIPHVIVLSASGASMYNHAGEVPNETIQSVFARAAQ